MCKRSFAAMLIAFTVFISAAATSRAADYSVTNNNDTGTGSLRQAIEDANATPSVVDTISFNITGTGPFTIRLSSVLPTITDTGLTINGITQAGSSCGTTTNANGGISNRTLNIGVVGPTGGSPSADTMTVTASNVTVQGISVVDGLDDIIVLNGADNFTLLCSHIGVGKDGITPVPSGGIGVFVDGSDNVNIGDGTLAGLNVISSNTADGLYVLNSDAISVDRNVFGLAIDGATERGNGGMGLEIDATTNAVISGNVSSANTQSGFSVFTGSSASSAAFTGNYVGTNAAGTIARANGETGIALTGIGTTASIGDGTFIGTNVVAGNTFTGVSINSGAVASLRGNYIGVGANGTTPLANGASGIFVQGTGTIGGANNGDGNIIANSGKNGVTLTGTASIVGNSIFDNTSLGIDLLGATGVDANDSGDGDSGPNDLLNYPVITGFAGDGTTLAEYDVSYDLPANASGHRIDFYKNSSADTSGHGEGEIHLGAITVGGGTGSGGGSFTANAPVNAGDIISATTTRIVFGAVYDKTSEFSANAVATSSADPLIVTSTADTDTIGTLRFAINHANANAGDDDITFDIAGSGLKTIVLTSALPSIADNGITVDGSTQGTASCGAAVDSNGVLTDRVLNVQIDASSSNSDALSISANSVTVKGLVIGPTQNFGNSAIDFDGGASGVVVCNHIGVSANGLSALTLEGLGIETSFNFGGAASSVQIGDGTYTGRNVIASTRRAELECQDNATSCDIRGNYVGVFADGFTQGTGISNNTVWIGGNNSVVGGPTAPERNVIGLSIDTGLAFSNGPSGVMVENNYIGVAADGVTILDNSLTGGIDAIEDSDTAQTLSNITIRNNVIGGFPNFGIDLEDSILSTVSIAGNRIGVGADGVSDIGYGLSAIALGATTHTALTIGGSGASDGNVMGFMSENGIDMNGTSNIEILGNYIGVGADGVTEAGNGENGIVANGVTNMTLGNGAAAGRNVISSNVNDGIKLSGTIDGVVIDGNYIGLGADGDTARGNAAGFSGAGIHFNTATSDGEIIRNNVISANGVGVYMVNSSVINTVMTGNYVGTDATGLLPRGNEFYGMVLDTGADGWTIGTPASGNIFAATPDSGSGIESYAGAHTFQNNKIGVGVDGTTALGNEGWGLRLYGGPHIVGGTGLNEGNIIANSGSNTSFANLIIQDSGSATVSGNIIRDGMGYAGLDLSSAGTVVTFHNNTVTNDLGAGIQLNPDTQLFAYDNIISNNGDMGIRFSGVTAKAAVYGNSIFGNAGLGIDLGGVSVTPNDTGDGDAGANDLLNFPVLNSFTGDGTTAVTYDFNLDLPSDANGYRIDFYKNSSADPSGHGEGETHLGFVDVAHAGGDLNFTGSLTTAEAVSVGNIISATATRKTGASTYDITSEFAANQTASSAASPLIVTSTDDTNTLGTLRFAINHANSNASDDDISFNIAGAGPHTITLSSDLPAITDTGVSLDGTTQPSASCGTALEANGVLTDRDLRIAINRDGRSNSHTLEVAADDVTLRGLALLNGFNTLEISGGTNLLAACLHIGVGVDGLTANKGFNGIEASGGTNSVIGGIAAGDRVIVAAALSSNITSSAGANGLTLLNTWIGVGADGTTTYSGTELGIELGRITNNFSIGDGTSAGRVIVAGHTDRNMFIQGGSGDIRGSVFGLGADESSLSITAQTNILITDWSLTPSSVLIGGSLAGDSNIIASGDTGIAVTQNSLAAILGNSLYGHTGLGINLDGGTEDANGVTANDNGDNDSGPNNLLNYPVLNDFTADGSTGLFYDFNLDVPSNANGYRIDFYKNSSADASGHGEGETHLGFVDIAHAGGDLNFTGSFTANEAVSIGDILTAATTRKTGASSYDMTSEFAANLLADDDTPLTAAQTVAIYDPLAEGLYAIPGNDSILTLTVSNPGSQSIAADTLVMMSDVGDDIDFYNGDIDDGGPETNPVSFTQSAGAGLTFTYATDIRYSNSATRPTSFAACVYTPSAGYDPNVTYVCINPKGSFAAGNPDPRFAVSYRNRIK